MADIIDVGEDVTINLDWVLWSEPTDGGGLTLIFREGRTLHLKHNQAVIYLAVVDRRARNFVIGQIGKGK